MKRERVKEQEKKTKIMEQRSETNNPDRASLQYTEYWKIVFCFLMTFTRVGQSSVTVQKALYFYVFIQ